MLGIFLDTETNGLNPFKHKVLELAYQMVDLFSGSRKEAFQAVIAQSQEAWQLSDKESLRVNGFRWEEVATGLSVDDVRRQVLSSFRSFGVRRGEAVFICQNPSFDRIFFSQIVDPDLQEELKLPYHWLDLASMYWVKAMEEGKQSPDRFPWKTGFSKDKIAAALRLSPEVTPHRAMNGVDHLLLCYESVVGFPK